MMDWNGNYRHYYYILGMLVVSNSCGLLRSSGCLLSPSALSPIFHCLLLHFLHWHLSPFLPFLFASHSCLCLSLSLSSLFGKRMLSMGDASYLPRVSLGRLRLRLRLHLCDCFYDFPGQHS